MKARLPLALICLASMAGLLLTLAWLVSAEASRLPAASTGAPTESLPQRSSLYNNATPATPVAPEHKQTVLLWPQTLERFQAEYPNWQAWLEGDCTSGDITRDALLTSARAAATMIPGDFVITMDAASRLIVVTGPPASLSGLLERLRGHPLLARTTGDSTDVRNEAATAWAQEKSLSNPAAPTLGIRNPWVSNVVWGQAVPSETVTVTLARNTHVLTSTVTADQSGCWRAFFGWDIRADDVVSADDGVTTRRASIRPLKFSADFASNYITVTLPETAGPNERDNGGVDIVAGTATGHVDTKGQSQFITSYGDTDLRPGAPGFLRYTQANGISTFLPLSLPIVNIRRDLSSGQLPYGSSHSEGVSQIVWGSATPESTLVITLTRPGQFSVTRSAASDQSGNYAVSMDRLIADGDVVQVAYGATMKTVQVPVLSYQADPATRIIAGIAPANITSVTPDAPHSLQVAIAGATRQVETSAIGEFRVDFTASPYIAGLLGAIRYTTAQGDRVFKPIFVSDPLARGKPGDWHADVILGQPDFSQITFNEVVGSKLFNPQGVYVDRSVHPNRVYVYDAGNNRVLGLSHLGICQAGSKVGTNCTTDSDCPDSRCGIQDRREADIVLGQSSPNTSGCDGDSSYQIYPDVPAADARALCGLPELANSVSESGSKATMATDSQGNLYVTDYFNNRVLRYNNPFETDTIADLVWGQADFAGTTCNRGASYSRPNSTSLCLAAIPGFGESGAGAAIDAAGNLWVADTWNNRVLRFPFTASLGGPASVADLVLGQPDFFTAVSGADLNQLRLPHSVRVGNDGMVYVADVGNGRVVVFKSPYSNGMAATNALSGLRNPLALELDSGGGLWVNDEGSHQIIHFLDGTIDQRAAAVDNRTWGGIGVDSDGNLMITGWDLQEVLRFSKSSGYQLASKILPSDPEGMFNQTGARGLNGGIGLEVAAGQLMYGDGSRILFWNNPWDLTNYQTADGVVGESSFQTRQRWGPWFGRMRADQNGRLWVVKGSFQPAIVYGYKLPLRTGTSPAFTVTQPLPLLGGGVFTWTESLILSGLDVQATCDCLWLSDRDNNRVFRIKNVSNQPVVDVVLGQSHIVGTQCNRGRGRDFPSSDSLCRPGALALDRMGNLFVADHNLETEGNWRLLEFDASTITNTSENAVFGTAATRVFGRNGDFNRTDCLPFQQDPMCGPWEPASDSRGRMVIGFNGYLGSRFPMVYQDPLNNPLPIASLGDFHSMPLSARFDQFDSLYILDHNRSRILIYRDRQVQTYAITGRITTPDGQPISGVQITTLGYASNGTSDASGVYALTGLINGAYDLIPSKTDYVFTPLTRTIDVPATTSGQDFTGYHAPVVLGVSPTSGVNDAATQITITGNYFVSGPKVSLDSTELSQTTWTNPTVIVATVPLGLPAKTYTLTVTNSNGQIGLLPNAFTVASPPTATIAMPSPGIAVSGMTTVTVTGEGERVELYLDETLHGQLYTFPATWSWSTWQVANGPHTLRAVSYGLLGRTATSLPVTVSVSNGIMSKWITAALPGKTVADVAVAPTDPRILYAVTEDGQIHKSHDRGMVWGRVDRGVLGNARLYAVAVSPDDARIVFVGGPDTGVHRTTDGGVTWLFTGLGSPITGLGSPIQDLAVARSQSSTIYAVGYGSYRSTDGGSTWSQVRSGFWSRNAAVDPFNATTVYVGTSSPWLGSIHKTADGGASWTVLPVQSAIGEITGIAIDPVDTNTLYVGKSWDGGGLYKSTDGGVSWARLNLQIGIGSVAAASSNRNIVYVGGQWSGVYQSMDRGTTWTDRSYGLPGESARALAVDPTDPEIVYAGLNNQGVWKYAPPPTPLPPSVSVSRANSDVVLNWPVASGYAAYEVWRHTSPYFDPVSPPATLVASGLPPASCTLADGTITCILPGGVGDPDTNYFYVVRGIRLDGTGAKSNYTGEFDFALKPGS